MAAFGDLFCRVTPDKYPSAGREQRRIVEFFQAPNDRGIQGFGETVDE
jgi:hypothetical protein